jgi:hypothetical protein
MTLSKMNVVAGLVMAGAIVAAGPASAQTPPPVQVSGGYQFLHLSGDGEGESLGKGWYGEVAGNLTPMFSAVFEIGGSYKSIDESLTIGGVTSTFSLDINVHQFLGGIRASSRRNPSIVSFGQVLVGAVKFSADGGVSASGAGSEPISFSSSGSFTEFGLQIAGGADFHLTDRAGLRLGAGYTRIFLDEGGGNAFRAIVGVVFPFAR